MRERTEVYVDFLQEYAAAPEVPTYEHPANCYFSAVVDSGYMHLPCIDIDIPARLIPSSTEGHFHLYFDAPVSWDNYQVLLKALSDCGIVEPGYVNVSIEQGGTTVRMPHVKKGGV